MSIGNVGDKLPDTVEVEYIYQNFDLSKFGMNRPLKKVVDETVYLDF